MDQLSQKYSFTFLQLSTLCPFNIIHENIVILGTGRQLKQFKSYFSFFDRSVSYNTQEKRSNNVFCLPCVNCYSFLFRWVLGRVLSCILNASSCNYIIATSFTCWTQLPTENGQISHLHFCTSYGNHFHKPSSLSR